MKRSQSVIVVSLVLTAWATSCTTSPKDVDPALTYHTAQAAKIKSLDPAFAEDRYTGIEVARVYESLLQYHYLKRPYELIPALAEGMPKVSADRRVYTFAIKKGVYFQEDPCFGSGEAAKKRELTAEDFIYSWKRIADPKILSPGWMYLSDLIEGLDEWREAGTRAGRADYAAQVAGLQAKDRYTLEVTLKRPLGLFLEYVAVSFLSVVPREAVEKYGVDFGNHPVGTGPFQLKDYRSSNRLIWDRNPTFRDEHYPTEGMPEDREAGRLADAGKRLPLVDRIVVEIIPESQPLWLNFLKGKIDISTPPKDAYAQAFTLTKDLSPELQKRGIRVTKELSPDLTFVTFNLRDPLLGKNKKLRQAMSLAFNQEEFNRIFYNDRALAAQGPLVPGVAGYDPKFKNPYRQFQITRAKALLAEAGYPDGKGLPELEYVTIADSDHRNIAEFIVKSFQALGIKIRTQSFSWQEYLKAVNDGRAQISNHAWVADYPDGQNLFQLFYSKNAPPAGNNSAFYSSAEFDRLYEQTLRILPGKERDGLYRKMVAILTEDCPMIFGAHRIGFSLVHPWVQNYKPHHFEHSAPKYYRIDPTVRAKSLGGV